MSEVLRDLVVSLSLDGDNFSRNLASINKQIQEAESEFRRAASGVENFEKSVSGTQSQLSSLQQKMALQQKAVKQYEKALEAANKKLENAYARQGRLTESLDAAKQKNADLKQQVAAATKQYERFSRELGESDSATLAAKANLDALSEEYAQSSAEVKKLEGQLAANAKTLQNNADAVTKARTTKRSNWSACTSTPPACARVSAPPPFAGSPGKRTGAAIVRSPCGCSTKTRVRKPFTSNAALFRTARASQAGWATPRKFACGWTCDAKH